MAEAVSRQLTSGPESEDVGAFTLWEICVGLWCKAEPPCRLPRASLRLASDTLPAVHAHQYMMLHVIVGIRSYRGKRNLLSQTYRRHTYDKHPAKLDVTQNCMTACLGCLVKKSSGTQHSQLQCAVQLLQTNRLCGNSNFFSFYAAQPAQRFGSDPFLRKEVFLVSNYAKSLQLLLLLLLLRTTGHDTTNHLST